jgi:hypothetical protein
MKFMIILSILIGVTYSQLPSVGQFIFTSYYDSKCVSPILNAVGIYNSTNQCWPISTNQSINPTNLVFQITNYQFQFVIPLIPVQILTAPF